MMDYVLFGAIAGDVCGSSYEAKFRRTKLYEAVRLVRTGNDFTDDTVCTIGVANAILKYKNPTPEQFGECIQEMCKKHPNRGYGGMFRKWIDNPVPYGSYGNGSAMRVSPVGFYAHNAKECLELAKNSALCSHNDPEGVKGAQAIALAIYRAKHDSITKNQIWYVLDNYYPEYTEKTLDEIRPEYHFDSTCQGSVPIALLAFLESKDYEDCLKLAISMGGDSDTIAAMAGSIAYAYYEKMPQTIFDQVWDVLDNEMIDIVENFDEVCE